MAAIDDAKAAVKALAVQAAVVSLPAATPAMALKRGHTAAQTNTEEAAAVVAAVNPAMAGSASLTAASGALVDTLKLYFDELYSPIGHSH